MAETPSHARVSDHLLNSDHLLKPIEVRVIQWIVKRLPAWVNSDMLTGVGVLGAIAIFFGYWLCRFDHAFLWLASLGFVINWFGDSLDGSLASFRNRQRPRYGFFIDHTTDTLSMILVFLGIGLSPFAKLSTALLALVSYLCMSILVYLRTCIEGVFDISFHKIGPTEMRLLVIILNTLIYFFGNPHLTLSLGIGRVTVLDIVGYVICIVFIIVYAISMVRHGIVYARQDSEKLKK